MPKKEKEVTEGMETAEIGIATTSIPITKKPSKLNEADLRDLKPGWVLDNGTNQLLITRYNVDEVVVQPTDDKKIYAGKTRKLIEGDKMVFFLIGTELKTSHEKIEKQDSMHVDDFIKFILKGKYAFLKKV